VSRRNLLVTASFVIATLVAIVAGIYVGEQRVTSSVDGAPLLAVSLPDATGREQPLAQWKGKVLVVNFWATWCAPCREEMPEFVRVQREFADKGVQFVGIAADSADKVSQFAQEVALNYPALIGGYGALDLSRTLGNNLMALPFTVVVDRSGRIVHTQLGPLREAKLRSLINGLL
jgi:thiol-disulfide isomerase/thioredoxin